MYEQHKQYYQHAGKCDDQQNLKDILYIETFEQKCAMIKCMSQSSRLEDHMKTIGVEQ